MRAGLPVTGISGGSMPKGGWFSRFSAAASRLAGRPVSFLLATLAIIASVGWAKGATRRAHESSVI